MHKYIRSKRCQNCSWWNNSPYKDEKKNFCMALPPKPDPAGAHYIGQYPMTNAEHFCSLWKRENSTDWKEIKTGENYVN
jgi:hypothetical protein